MGTTEIDWTPKARAVLAAATELFYDHGIHAVGVEAVAARAGVTKKTLYDRFGSKERLVVEYLLERDRQWRTLLDARLAEAGRTPEDRLATLFTTSAEWARTRGHKGCGMVNAHAEISDPAHPAHAVIVGQKRWTLDLLRDLAADAGVADVAAVAEELALLHEGALVAGGIGVPERAHERARTAALGVLSRAARAASSG